MLGEEKGGHPRRSSSTGKGTEVGKHGTCVEINKEPGLPGKRGLCQGVVAMRLEGGQECYIFQVGLEAATVIPCRRAAERIGQQRALLCGPWRDGVGGQEAVAASLRFCPAPCLFRCYATGS